MRLVSFFVLSLCLHASALVYPVSFGAQRQPEIIHVAILPMERESIGVGGHGDSGKAAPRAGPKSAVRTLPRDLSPIRPELAEVPKPHPTPRETVANFSDDSVAIPTTVATSAETHGTATSAFPNDSLVYDTGPGEGGPGTGGNAFGWSGNGARQTNGFGHGNGRAAATLGGGGVLTQARYRHTPPPDYPESAKREGREGRVLLRVLVDEQGRTKQVEINSSSGNEALDRSAAEAVSRWRFSPARYGDAPTASWVKIPVDFRLKEVR